MALKQGRVNTVLADCGRYPALLVTTSTRDDRVHAAHARKFVAKLKDRKSTNTLYYENIEGGHAGAADNKQRAFMYGDTYHQNHGEFFWCRF